MSKSVSYLKIVFMLCNFCKFGRRSLVGFSSENWLKIEVIFERFLVIFKKMVKMSYLTKYMTHVFGALKYSEM